MKSTDISNNHAVEGKWQTVLVILDAVGETLFGVAVGLVFYSLDQHAMGLMLATIGAILSIGRFLLTRALGQKVDYSTSVLILKLEPVERMAEVLALDNTMSVRQFEEMMQVYLRITEPDFISLREAIVAEAAKNLKRLADEKATPLLHTGTYYGWLLPKIETAKPGSRIWAVSMMLDTEWTEMAHEEKFLHLNLEAAKRGVLIERIFVVSKAKINDMGLNPGVRAHIHNSSKNLHPMLVLTEDLEKSSDHKLLHDLGDGMIAFDEHDLLIDASAREGMRGTLTKNPALMGEWKENYARLRNYAYELTDENLKRWNSKNSEIAK